ncbi:MAG: CARDB domain-containing protein [Gemmataceae bacterium]
MPRTLLTAALALSAALSLTTPSALAQRRPDSNEPSRDRDDRRDDRRDRDGADLVVRRIRFDRDDIRVEVENVGNRRAGESRLAVIVVTPSGRRFLTAEVPPLRPGQDRAVRVEANFRVNQRGTEIIAVADVLNDVRERNERNNTLTRVVD